MKRLWIILVCLLLPAAAHAQLVNFQNNCEVGGKKVTTQGMQSSSFFQQSYPGCLVTVYAHGTTNLSTIYADSSSTPLSNPFTASTTTGNFIFWANSGVYDVVISAGQPSPGLTIPFTYVAGLAQGGGGGGGQTANPVVFFSNATSVTLLGASYGFNTNGFVWDCYDSNNNSLDAQDAKPSVGPPPTYNFTVYFNQPQSGYCTANSNNGGSGTYVNPIISVVTYGAKGDGVTDDTAAINAAMTACNTTRVFPYNGCTLYFPSGIYITTGLTWPSFTSGKGDGWGTSVIQLKPNTNGDVVTVPVSSFNFSLYGLTIDGNDGNGSTGNCLTFATTPVSPTEWNTANKQTASIQAQKWAHLEEMMFSNCSLNGLNVNVYNYMIFADNFYIYNNGVYGLYTQGTNSQYSNFQIEHNGTAGIHVINANNRFTSGEVIWNGYTNNTEAGVYVKGGRSSFIAVQAEDNYTNGFYDQSFGNMYIACIADDNGYVQNNPNASSQTASGFIIAGISTVFLGDKVTTHRGVLPDGHYATQWPYTYQSGTADKTDISYDTNTRPTNQPPPVVAGDIQLIQNVSLLPSTAIATSSATDAGSEPLDFRGSWWNGSSAQFSDWIIQYSLNNTGTEALTFTPPIPGTQGGAPAISFPQQFTATSSSGNYDSVVIQLQSSVWGGSAPLFPGWALQSTVGTGTNPDLTFTLLPYNITGTPTINLNAFVNLEDGFKAVGNANVTGSQQWGGGAAISTSDLVPQVGTPVVNQAACWTSASPKTLGHCTSTVNSSGACTCVP